MKKKVLFEPFPKQMEFIDAAMSGNYDFIFYGGSIRGGKLLPIDTPIATPKGWTTMFDLKEGDKLFDAEGKICKVTWKSEIESNPNSYEIIFNDGSSIQCDADHQWVTTTFKERMRIYKASEEYRNERKAKRPLRGTGKRPWLSIRNSQNAKLIAEVPEVRGNIRTTQQIIDTFLTPCGKYKNHAIVNCGYLDLPERNLPIKPYTLGAWLGDGTSMCGQITNHPNDSQILDEIENDGYIVTHNKTPNSHNVVGLAKTLRLIGLKGNKHIPIEYLRASKSQRLELLQGLCDTDGYCDKTSGKIEFTTTSVSIKDGFLELLYSLGIKPSCKEFDATLNGKVISKKYRILFVHNEPCFKLKRKLERQKINKGWTRLYRTIVDYKKVEPVPMQCISVDSPSRTYLCGKNMLPTHNSVGVCGLFIMICHFFPGAKYIICRKDIEILKSTTLKSFNEVVPDSITKQKPSQHNGWEWVHKNGSVIKFFAESISRDPNLMRFRGLEYDGIAFDEMDVQQETFEKAFERVGTWKMNERKEDLENGLKIPPRLVIGTSNPQDGWVRAEIHDPYVEGTLKPRWCYIKSRVYDNNKIPSDWVEKLRISMTPEDFEKFVDGNWDIDKNKVKYFTHYKDKIHYSKDNVFDFENVETWLSFDFNYDPTTCTVFQVYDDCILMMRNYGVTGGTKTLCDLMKEDKELMKIPKLYWYVTGDTNGTNNSATAGDVTDYDIIKDYFRLTDEHFIGVHTRNKAHVYSRRLCEWFLYKTPFAMDGRCSRSRDDLLKAKPVEGTNDLYKNRKMGFGMDYLDNFRYFVDAKFPMGTEDITRFADLARIRRNSKK